MAPTRPWISRFWRFDPRFQPSRFQCNQATHNEYLAPKQLRSFHTINMQFSGFLMFSAQLELRFILHCLQRDSFSSKKGQSFNWISETCGSAGNIAWLKANHQNFQIDGASLWGPSLLRRTRTRNNSCLHTKGSTWGIRFHDRARITVLRAACHDKKRPTGVCELKQLNSFQSVRFFLKTKVTHNRGFQVWRAKLMKSAWAYYSWHWSWMLFLMLTSEEQWRPVVCRTSNGTCAHQQRTNLRFRVQSEIHSRNSTQIREQPGHWNWQVFHSFPY